MILERSVSFELRDTGTDTGDGRTLTGHAAVFNQETLIDSWEGSFIETIAPGAFRKTIRERTPVLQFEHGRHPLVGSMPIGNITDLREDTEGLAVTARLSDNWLIEPVRDAISNKSVKGMSFRFEVMREEWRDNAGQLVKPDELMKLLWDAGDRGPLKRTLKELKVAELGPVVFPAYAGTDVSVRAREAAQDIYKDKELLRSLRSSLALGWNTYKTDQASEMQKEVAAAILFDSPRDDHQSTYSYLLGKEFAESLKGYVRDAVYTPEQAIEIVTAPTPEGHPVEEELREETPVDAPVDAPVPDDHPSPKEASSDFLSKVQYSLRAMDRRLDNAIGYGEHD